MDDHGQGDWPSRDDSFERFFVGLFYFMAFAGICWLVDKAVEGLTGQDVGYWFGQLLVVLGVTWVVFLLVCVPIIGVLALLFGGLVTAKEWLDKIRGRSNGSGSI